MPPTRFSENEPSDCFKNQYNKNETFIFKKYQNSLKPKGRCPLKMHPLRTTSNATFWFFSKPWAPKTIPSNLVGKITNWSFLANIWVCQRNPWQICSHFQRGSKKLSARFMRFIYYIILYYIILYYIILYYIILYYIILYYIILYYIILYYIILYYIYI